MTASLAAAAPLLGALGIVVFERGWLSANNVLFLPSHGAPARTYEKTMAGPAAAMAALLPTNRPAPMTPPIVIMVTWRDSRERLSSWLVGASAGTTVELASVKGEPQGRSGPRLNTTTAGKCR